jgi:hypothetical protein
MNKATNAESSMGRKRTKVIIFMLRSKCFVLKSCKWKGNNYSFYFPDFLPNQGAILEKRPNAIL